MKHTLQTPLIRLPPFICREKWEICCLWGPRRVEHKSISISSWESGDKNTLTSRDLLLHWRWVSDTSVNKESRVASSMMGDGGTAKQQGLCVRLVVAMSKSSKCRSSPTFVFFVDCGTFHTECWRNYNCTYAISSAMNKAINGLIGEKKRRIYWRTKEETSSVT